MLGLCSNRTGVFMKPVERDLFTEFHYLSDLQISSDKTRLYFVETQCDMKENGYRHRLWSMDPETAERHPLTPWAPSCSYTVNERGLYLLEPVKEKPGTVIKTLCPDNGETRGSFTLPLRVTDLRPFGEKEWLVTAACSTDCPDYHLLTEGERQEYLDAKAEDADYHVVTEYPFVFNGRGFINGNRTRLFIADEKSAPKALVSGNTNVSSADICDTKIVYSGAEYEYVQKFTSKIWLYDSASNETCVLYDKDDMSVRKVWFSEGRVLAIASVDGTNDNPKVYEVKDGEMHLLIDCDMNFGSSLATDAQFGKLNGMYKDQDDLLFNGSDCDEVSLFRIHGDQISRVYHCGGSVDTAVTGNGALYAIMMKGQALQEVYRIKGDQVECLTDFNAEVLKDRYVAEPQMIVLDKETPIHGWVLLPKDYDPDKKYPAILDIHGGPEAIYGTVYYHEMQYWASLGYFVFFCNPRGSAGRGTAFADLRPAWGTIDYEDIMDFTDAVLAKYPAIDQKRVGVTGGSYGGYMTNWIIGHTDRFAAAASQRSISNWISELLVSDISVGFIHNMMSFPDIRHCDKELWDMSPLKYVNNAVTPTLFIHSTEDYRCPMPEAVQMFTALRLVGVDTKLVMFNGENHGLSRGGKPKHRIRRLKEITAWMNQYLENNE